MRTREEINAEHEKGGAHSVTATLEALLDIRDLLAGAPIYRPVPPDVASLEFLECATCRAKPGSPELCDGCLNNRTAISRLQRHRMSEPRLVESTEDDDEDDESWPEASDFTALDAYSAILKYLGINGNPAETVNAVQELGAKLRDANERVASMRTRIEYLEKNWSPKP